jgi:hypothetical protein
MAVIVSFGAFLNPIACKRQKQSWEERENRENRDAKRIIDFECAMCSDVKQSSVFTVEIFAQLYRQPLFHPNKCWAHNSFLGKCIALYTVTNSLYNYFQDLRFANI